MTVNNSELEVTPETASAAIEVLDVAWEGSKIAPGPWPYIWRNSSASATYFVTLLENIKLADSRLKASTDANTAYADAWAEALRAQAAQADLERAAAEAANAHQRASTTLTAAEKYHNDYISVLVVAAGESAVLNNNIVSVKEQALSDFDTDAQPLIAAAWDVITAVPPSADTAINTANRQLANLATLRLVPKTAVDTAKSVQLTKAAYHGSIVSAAAANRDMVIGPLRASFNSTQDAAFAASAALVAPPTTWHSTVVKHIKKPSVDTKDKLARIWMPMTGQ
jgi:hypothetical protein